MFGCEQLGGFEWGDVNETAIYAAIDVAVENGVALFDTADCYGRGLSEERIGKALAGVGDRVEIATKGGVRFGLHGVFYDNSADYLANALDCSLMRLGLEQVGLYQVHHWDNKTPVEEICGTLEIFVASGKIAAYGLCNIPDLPSDPDAFPNLKSLSLEYSLADRAAEKAASAALGLGLHFLPYGALGQGVLSGKYRANSTFAENDRRGRAAYGNFHGERFAHNLRIVAVLERWSRELGYPVASLALAWVRSLDPRVWPLVGIKKPSHIDDALRSLQVEFPGDALAELDAISKAEPEGAAC